MRRKLISGLLISYLLSTAAPAACLLDDYSVKAEYARSTAVVLATVMSERLVPDGQGGDIGGTMYRIKLQESFRGKLHGTVEIFSENSSGRFPMLKGKSYLLFLSREGSRLSADNCGNSGLESQKKNVLAEVRSLHK